jgi:phosphoribosylaminoimidazole-succinocarboxamide synthase
MMNFGHGSYRQAFGFWCSFAKRNSIKGQILNQIATKFMELTQDIVLTGWLQPDPNVAVGHLCEPFKVEMVIRGYFGHAAREYSLVKEKYAEFQCWLFERKW